ncbi:MAG: TldD/PmbA family protein [Clostridiales bacterium]|jgi:TldD protein|nr:TldD/PmbA family protein [Clostridiales bacterium]
MLDKELVYDVLTVASQNGGPFAEIFVENNEKNSLSMINGAVEKALWGVDYGCGIRVFSGYGAVYAYTNDTSRDNLLKVAREASQAAQSGKKVLPSHLDLQKSVFESIHPVRISPASASKMIAAEKLRMASEAAFAYSARISQTAGSFLGYVQDVLIANSDGLWAEDRRTRSRVLVEAVASSPNEKQVGYMGPGAHMGFEFLDTLDFKEIGFECARIAITMLDAELCPSGRMPVIIDNGFGGVIFHEACGHSLEATSVAIKNSVFSDSLGKKIASDKVTAIDDGTMPGEWGSLNIDDEGTKTQRSVLIEDGVLKSFLIDKLNGLRMGMASTGSSRRESYKFAPTSRMTNTYIAAGSDRPEDIIAETEYGLYAKKMGGGSVQPATGEFNFAVTEGYMIRNGKITEPVRGATLIGKGSEVLLNIDRVADNLLLAQGMCGSLSGLVPTNVGQPMIRVKELTVGGRR